MNKSILIDFLTAGVTKKEGDSCKLSDLWSGRSIGTFKSNFYATGIQPHDHMALKVVCSTAAAADETPSFM